MYAQLKAWGISNRDAASLLLNSALTFDGRMLRDRIEESSQLSRRIVHTAPGEIPVGIFNSFQITCPQLLRSILRKLSVSRYAGDVDGALRQLNDDLETTCARTMMQLLRDFDIDESPYRNMQTYLNHADLANEQDRTLLRLMLFVITGCLGNPRTASTVVVDYATNVLGADFHTAQTIISAATQPSDAEVDLLLGLVRVIDGRIEAGSRMHVLDPAGTEIGLMPTGRHVVSDVGTDASRRHALAWRENGTWYLRDLGSTNGTQLISGADGSVTDVSATPVELSTSDVVCLGATTRFIVIPIVGV